MSIELQIRSVTLDDLLGRSVQQALRATCIDPVGPVYVDHADVVPAPVQVNAVGAAVRLTIQVDVFLVSRDAVDAAPNAVPAGATAPAGRVGIVLEMAVRQTTVSLRCVDVTGPLGPAAPPIRTAICAAIGTPVSFDLADVLSVLGMAQPRSSSVELAGGTVSIRFEPMGGPRDHLPPGHDWGLFLDGGAVEVLAKTRLNVQRPPAITSLAMTPHWRPAGSTPHVDIDYHGKAQVDIPTSAEFNGTLFCDLAVRPTPAQRLRTTVNWSFHINFGNWVPDFIEEGAANLVKQLFDPTMIGATPAGGQTFFFENRLPDIRFGDARFDYASAVASPAGMTIGGPVRMVVDPSRAVLQTSVAPFSAPHFQVIGSLQGCIWGWAGREPTAEEMTMSAGVGLEGCGQFCGFEVVPHDDLIASYVTHDPVSQESQSVRVKMPALVAARIMRPVRLRLRTSRGVRLVDLGKPTVTFDEGGNVVGAVGAYLDDCLYVDMRTLYWIETPVDPVTGHPLPPPPDPWPPPDWKTVTPNWLTYPPEVVHWETSVEGLTGLSVQLVTVTGLDAGELIQFRSIERAVDVTADQNGRAIVPVFLSYRERLEPAKLSCTSRKNLEGRVQVRTALFLREAVLPAGHHNQLIAAADGTAVVITAFGDRHETYRIASGAAWSRVDDDNVSGEAPAAGPVDESSVDLPGLASIIRIPGFDDAPIAIAHMDDGSCLVLDLAREGSPRVAGTFVGPIGPLDIANDWAIANRPDRLIVYRVMRP